LRGKVPLSGGSKEKRWSGELRKKTETGERGREGDHQKSSEEKKPENKSLKSALRDFRQ